MTEQATEGESRTDVLGKKKKEDPSSDADSVIEEPVLDPKDESAEPTPEEHIEALAAERDVLKEKLLRSQAECANISKRLTQQHNEALKLAGMNLAKAMLPILDSFDRTLNALNENAADEAIAEGVRLIAEEFRHTFQVQGIEPIEALGQVFDPTRHEALMQDQSADAPPGTVTQELERGYAMHNRVLRPAKVAVAASRPEPEANQEPEEGDA